MAWNLSKMNEPTARTNSTSPLASSVGQNLRVHSRNRVDSLRDSDRPRSESGGLRTSIPFDWFTSSAWSGSPAGQIALGYEGGSTAASRASYASTAADAPSTTAQGLRPPGRVVSHVKHRWHNRMERAERIWVVFCTTTTLGIVLVNLLTEGHL